MGHYKDGKPNKETDLEDLKKRLSKSKLSLRKKAYIILLYWLGCRMSEPLVLKKENINEKDGFLYVAIHYRIHPKTRDPIPFSRGKHGQAGGPIELNLNLWGLDLVKTIWLNTKRKRLVFPFSDTTAWRAFKQVWKHRTPHWLRYNRVTKLRKRLLKDLTMDDIKSYTGIRRDSTIEGYGLKTDASIHRVSDKLE